MLDGAFATIDVIAAEPDPLECLSADGLTSAVGLATLEIILLN